MVAKPRRVPFALVANSEINEGMYWTFFRPWVQGWVSDATAKALRRRYPNRLQYSLFSDENPWMRTLGALAEWVRDNRRSVSPDNPFLAMEKAVSDQIADGLRRYGAARDKGSGLLFNAIDTSGWLQAARGERRGIGHACAGRGTEDAEGG
jgi:hypothetical protein